jgi:hypothetical protein
MRPRDDSLGEMVRTVWLDRGTADSLLSGSVPPDDAPPGYTDVARLLRAVATPPSPRELAPEVDAAAAAETILRARSAALPTPARSGARPRTARSRYFRIKVTSLVVVGTLIGTSGLAAAGVLPDPVQTAASRVLDAIGIDVPDPSAVEHPASTGEEISEIATTTDAEGVDKGAEISDAASGGISRAGDEHGPPESVGEDVDTTDAPRGAGADVADAVSGGHSSAGSGGPPTP